MEYSIGPEWALVDHHIFIINIPAEKMETNYNRELRNWLARNCGVGWETKLLQNDQIKVWFPIEQTNDVLKFKLAWHPFQS